MQKHYLSQGLIGLLLAGMVLLLVACAAGTVNQSGTTATPSQSSTTATLKQTGTTATPTAATVPTQAQFVLYTSGSKSLPDTIGVLRASDGTLLWHNATAGGAVRGLKIVDGVVYVGTYKGYVYAFRINDGKLLWQNQFGGLLEWLDVANGTVYFEADALSTPAQPVKPFAAFYALRATDGSILWQRQLLTNLPAGVFVSSSAVLSDGVIYATLNAASSPGASGYQFAMDSLSAFSTNDGHTLWSYSLTGTTALIAPLVAGGVVYASTERLDQNAAAVPGAAILYAVQQSNGNLLWKYQDSISSYFNPQAAGNGAIYVEGQTVKHPGSIEFDYVFALRTSDGSQLWRDQLTDTSANNSENFPTRLTVLNTMLYVGEMEQGPGAGTGRVFALQASNGKIAWHDDIAQIGITEVQVLVADDMVYVGQNENMVSALQAGNGAVLWRHTFGESEGGAFKLAASNGMVYVGTYPDLGGGHSVCAIQANNGTQLWCHMADAGVITIQVSQ